jgi:hypothetical protein
LFGLFTSFGVRFSFFSFPVTFSFFRHKLFLFFITKNIRMYLFDRCPMLENDCFS